MKRACLGLLAGCVTVGLSAQQRPTTVDLMRIQELLQTLQTTLIPPPPSPIATPAELTAALAGTDPVLTLDPALVFPTALTIRRSVTLQASAVPEGRMSREPLLPRFNGGLTVTGDDVTLIGLDVRHTNSFTDIVVLTGAGITLDRVRVLGDPVKGAKRCILTDTNGRAKVLRSYAADCFQPSPGNDSQAIGGFSMAPGLLVEDSYLEGGSETVMFGGADRPEDRTPTDIVFRGNTITKNPAWMGQPIGVKNLVELKNAKRVTFENNSARIRGRRGKGPSDADGAEPGRPRAVVHDSGRDVSQQHLVRRRRRHRDSRARRHQGDARGPVGAHRHRPAECADGARHDSGRHVRARSPQVRRGQHGRKIIQLAGGPTDVTIDNVTITAASKASSAFYFATSRTPAITGLTLTNVTFPLTSYGMFGEGAGVTVAAKNFTATNSAWTKYMS